MSDILIAIAGVITAAGTGFFGWFFGRRKTKAEAITIEEQARTILIDNEIKLSDYYKIQRDEADELHKKRLNELEEFHTKHVKLLQDEINLLKKSNSLLKKQISEVKQELEEKNKVILKLQK